jgi:hypothetical protein
MQKKEISHEHSSFNQAGGWRHRQLCRVSRVESSCHARCSAPWRGRAEARPPGYWRAALSPLDARSGSCLPGAPPDGGQTAGGGSPGGRRPPFLDCLDDVVQDQAVPVLVPSQGGLQSLDPLGWIERASDEGRLAQGRLPRGDGGDRCLRRRTRRERPAPTGSASGPEGRSPAARHGRGAGLRPAGLCRSVQHGHRARRARRALDTLTPEPSVSIWADDVSPPRDVGDLAA